MSRHIEWGLFSLARDIEASKDTWDDFDSIAFWSLLQRIERWNFGLTKLHHDKQMEQVETG